MSSVGRALVDELLRDEEALDALAEKLAPRIAAKQDPHQTEDGWLDTKAAAAYVGITISALYRHTACRAIPFEQDVLGGKCWFKRSQLDAWRKGEWQRSILRPAA